MNHFLVTGYNEIFGNFIPDFVNSCQFQFGVMQF
jgi:hypothetical protein